MICDILCYYYTRKFIFTLHSSVPNTQPLFYVYLYQHVTWCIKKFISRMMETHKRKNWNIVVISLGDRKKFHEEKKPSSHFIHLETNHKIELTSPLTTHDHNHHPCIEWCNSPDNSLDERDRVRETLELTHFGYTEWKNESANSILPDYRHEIPPNIKMRRRTLQRLDISSVVDGYPTQKKNLFFI